MAAKELSLCELASGNDTLAQSLAREMRASNDFSTDLAYYVLSSIAATRRAWLVCVQMTT